MIAGIVCYGFLPVEAAELIEGDVQQDMEDTMSMRGLESSEIVSLKDATAQMFRESLRKTALE